ncbi:RNA polymerase sigma factor [Paenibacillus mesophilus]|uniref:RNA polymerase sigma factor n=1 Tax=Paenibacillus mesophilus TaxID=2582849 RepID=UPI00110E3EF5|nr:RNA polymerase sigma factor [Paenibacillus mesophilus]TMV43273.1 RNA polymerase sigma factor [Paenibacillus mesophilus]
MHASAERMEDLYARYHHRLSKYLQLRVDKQTAEDLAQTTFVKALENLHAFRDHASPFTWLWRIASNTLKNEYRSKCRRREEYTDLGRLDSRFVSCEFVNNVEIRIDIGSAMRQLNETDREILTLHYDIGCTLKEISEIVGLKLSTTKNRLYRALAKLRVELADHEEVPAIMSLVQNFLFMDHPTLAYAAQVREDLISELGSRVERITELLRHQPAEKLTIEISPDLDAFHRAVGEPDAPDWFMGVIDGTTIKIVSPLNPGPAHTYKSVLQSTVHLFTNLMVKEVNPTAPKWLYQGLGGYEAGLMTRDYIRDSIRGTVERDDVPTFEDLEDDSWDFERKKGFQFAYTLAEFILREYGEEGLNRLVRKPTDFKDALRCSEPEFRSRWIAFLKVHYA